MTGKNQPSVSIIVPVYNEQDYIERCLQALTAQDYPGEIEILCIDGISTDATRSLMLEVAEHDRRVRIVDNPHRIIPAALNIGVREAQYDLIVRMDGHAIAARDHVRKCVETYQSSGADHVGGYCRFEGDTYIARSIAAVMKSRFGVGPAMWRTDKSSGDADTVPYGLWHRDKLLALGGFNESLLVNEDYEFNYRLRKSGGRVYFSPEIVSVYYVRRSLLQLAIQYFRYGLWKVRMLKLYPESIRWRQVAPPLFVGGLILGPVALILHAVLFWCYVSSVVAYALLVCVFSVRQASQSGWALLPLLPAVFLILHISWGIGFWAGVWKWIIMREDRREKQRPTSP